MLIAENIHKQKEESKGTSPDFSLLEISIVNLLVSCLPDPLLWDYISTLDNMTALYTVILIGL